MSQTAQKVPVLFLTGSSLLQKSKVFVVSVDIPAAAAAAEVRPIQRSEVCIQKNNFT